MNALQRHGGKGLQLVEPKTARSRRRLILPVVALNALREQWARSGGEAGGIAPGRFVFTAGNGQPLDASNVRRSFEHLLAKAEVPRIRFHDLRHTAATLLLAEGVHPRVVMDVLGHSQISMTLNTYSHVIPPLLRDAAMAMDRVLGAEHREMDR